MTLRTLIIDDEPIALEKLKKYVERSPQLSLAAACTDGFEAMEYLKTNEADLIITDINMPDLNGLDFVRALQNRPPVIFTTAYPQYAIEGYKVSAVDYLLKPYGFVEFSQAVAKAEERLKERTAPAGARQTLSVSNGTITYYYPASDKEMSFTATTVTIDGNSFQLSEYPSMEVIGDCPVEPNTVAITFDGTGAKAQIHGSVAQYVSVSISGADVTVNQSDLVSESTCGEITYNKSRFLKEGGIIPPLLKLFRNFAVENDNQTLPHNMRMVSRPDSGNALGGPRIRRRGLLSRRNDGV